MRTQPTKTCASSLSDFQAVVSEAHRQHRAGGGQLIRTLRHDAGGVESPTHLASRTDSLLLKEEDVLHADDVGEGAGQLRDVRDTARSVAHTRSLHDNVDSRSDLGANGLF